MAEHPTFSERLFYRNSREVLNLFAGVEDIRDPAIEAVRLHPVVFDVARRELEGTLNDSRERWAKFNLRNGKIRVHSGVGEWVDFGKGEAVGYAMKESEMLSSIFLGRPVPVLFHTHPNTSYNDLINQGVTRIVTRFGSPMSLADVPYVFNTYAQFFSSDDMKFFGLHRRYTRSMLLATKGGYTWVIDPDFNAHFPRHNVNIENYSENMDSIINHFAERVVTNPTFADLEKFKEDSRGTLREFCTNSGLIAFYNEDNSDPTLRRL